ncbi:MAG: hypothetical protein IIX62_02400 [Peptococcaceae bacterium]|nr:hypothetical protein [Peptococcaceae bacterium]
MRYFHVEEDSFYPGLYMVTLKIVIYRHIHGKYPDFLKSFDTEDAARNGHSTNFWFLCKQMNGEDAVLLTREEAMRLADTYEAKYREIISYCETSGNWESYPFKDLALVYSK